MFLQYCSNKRESKSHIFINSDLYLVQKYEGCFSAVIICIKMGNKTPGLKIGEYHLWDILRYSPVLAGAYSITWFVWTNCPWAEVFDGLYSKIFWWMIDLWKTTGIFERIVVILFLYEWLCDSCVNFVINQKLMLVYFFPNFIGSKYVLKMRIIDHIYDEFVVDNLALRIILPEGCT